MSPKKLLEALFLFIFLEGFSPWISEIFNFNIANSLEFYTLLYLIKGGFLTTFLALIHPELKPFLFLPKKLNIFFLQNSLWGILLGCFLYIQTFLLKIFLVPTSIEFLKNSSYSHYVFFPLVIIFCLAVALSEETFYRVYISHIFLEKVKYLWIKIIFTTSFFSLAHISSSPQNFMLLVILSFELTLIYELTKNITIIIISHALYNFFIISSFFF